MNPKYDYNPDNNCAVCVITGEGGTKYYGRAYCHPDDKEFASEKTGLTIAELRAQIDFLTDYKNKLTIEYKALKQLYYSINLSKQFNEKSYEAKALKRHMKMKEYDIVIASTTLKETKEALKNFISAKEGFYKKIRKLRAEKEGQE